MSAKKLTLASFLSTRLQGTLLPVQPTIVTPGTVLSMAKSQDLALCEHARISLREWLPIDQSVSIFQQYFDSIGWSHDLGVSTGGDVVMGDVWPRLGVCLCFLAFYEPLMSDVLVLSAGTGPIIS